MTIGDDRQKERLEREKKYLSSGPLCEALHRDRIRDIDHELARIERRQFGDKFHDDMDMRFKKGSYDEPSILTRDVAITRNPQKQKIRSKKRSATPSILGALKSYLEVNFLVSLPFIIAEAVKQKKREIRIPYSQIINTGQFVGNYDTEILNILKKKLSRNLRAHWIQEQITEDSWDVPKCYDYLVISW